MVIHEFSFWSPFLGSYAVRLSTSDDRCQEYFAIVPKESARQWRNVKYKTIDALQAALDAGMPGEVKVNL